MGMFAQVVEMLKIVGEALDRSSVQNSGDTPGCYRGRVGHARAVYLDQC